MKKEILMAHCPKGREITLKMRSSLNAGYMVLTKSGWETLTKYVVLKHSSTWNSLTQAVDKMTWIEDEDVTSKMSDCYLPVIAAAKAAGLTTYLEVKSSGWAVVCTGKAINAFRYQNGKWGQHDTLAAAIVKAASDFEFDQKTKAKALEAAAINATVQAERKQFSDAVAAAIVSGEYTAHWSHIHGEGTVFNKAGNIVAIMHQNWSDFKSSKDAWTIGTRHHAGATATGFSYSKV